MKKLIALTACMLLLAGNAWAGSVDTYGIGSKATALGGAFAAYADDPFAIYYNPSGLHQIEQPTASAGVHFIDSDIQIDDFEVPTLNIGPESFSDKYDPLYAPHMGFAAPLPNNDRMTLGIAAYAPFGLGLEWDDDPAQNPGAYSAYETGYQRMVVTPTVAYEVTDRLSVGAGLSLGRSSYKQYFRPYDLVHFPAQIPMPDGTMMPTGGPFENADVQLEVDESLNHSINIGLMYKATENLTLGLTYRGKTDADMDGDVELKGLTDMERQQLEQLGLPAPKKVNAKLYDLNHPRQVQAGVRYEFPYDVSLEGDLVWTHWSDTNKTTVEFDQPFLEYGPDNPRVKKRSWEDTVQLRLGMEWALTEQFRLRGGYFYDPTPIPDHTVALDLPDADKKTYSLGAGYDINESWTVDTVFQYTRVEGKRYVGGESGNLNESFDDEPVSMRAEGELWGLGATITCRF